MNRFSMKDTNTTHPTEVETRNKFVDQTWLILTQDTYPREANANV